MHTAKVGRHGDLELDSRYTDPYKSNTKERSQKHCENNKKCITGYRGRVRDGGKYCKDGHTGRGSERGREGSGRGSAGEIPLGPVPGVVVAPGLTLSLPLELYPEDKGVAICFYRYLHFFSLSDCEI